MARRPLARRPLTWAAAVLVAALATSLVPPAGTAAPVATSLGCTGTTAADQRVDHAFVTLLARCPDAGGRAWARGLLEAGGPGPRLELSLAATIEARRRLVRELYLLALVRAGDATGVEHFVAQLRDPAQAPAVYAALLGSAEAVAKAGTQSAWLDRLALFVVGRPLDASGRAYWQGRLDAGATPARVARSTLATPEARAATTRTLVSLPSTGRNDAPLPATADVAAAVRDGRWLEARALVASRASDRRPRAILSGDSLPSQAGGAWRDRVEAGGVVAQPLGLGTFAPCDGLQFLVAVAALSRPDVVAVSYIGNHATACMRDVPADQVVARYATDLQKTVSVLTGLQPGVRVVLVTPPPTDPPHAMYADELAALYEGLATASTTDALTVADGRTDLTTPDGGFAGTLPCLPEEPQCTGPVVDGVPSNVVRSADGIHLCTGETGPDGCVGWSSGAWRFGRNLADAVEVALAA